MKQLKKPPTLRMGSHPKVSLCFSSNKTETVHLYQGIRIASRNRIFLSKLEVSCKFDIV